MFKHSLKIFTIIYIVPVLLVIYLSNYQALLWDYLKITLVIFIPSLLTTLVIRKFYFEDKFYSIKRFYYSFIITLGLIANLLFVIQELQHFKTIIISALFISFVLEILWLKLFIKPQLSVLRNYISIPDNFSFFVFLIVIIIYSLSFYEILRGDTIYAGFNNLYLFIGIFTLLYISVRLTYNFSLVIKSNYWEFFWKHFKSFVLFISLLFFFFSFFDFNKFLVNEMSSHIGIYVLSSFTFFTLYYFWKKNINNYDPVRFKLKKVTIVDYSEISHKLFRIVSGKYRFNDEVYDKNHLREQLQKIYFKGLPEVFKKIDDRVDLLTFDPNRIKILRSRDEYNIDVIEDESLQLFVNFHRINDFRRINQYFIKVNYKLKKGGIFILNFEPLEYRYKAFIESYSTLLGRILYFIDFLWHRFIPKIPIFQKIYFNITDGYNRAISFAEALGRLRYCGFEILDVFRNDGEVFILAIKNQEPLDNLPLPSYGLFFKMKRVGEGGKTIFVYKMRTMHPFSEFIQDLSYKLNELDVGGKIKNDFRITSWGRFLRFFWLDELPMLINFLKGELKLVGVRPISQHYLNLYPEDVKQLRVKTKPGLIPPFYYDLPDTLEEIVESERRYLLSYFENPRKTDLKYFMKAMYNILIKGARSK